MIQTFRHKGLEELWGRSRSRQVDKRFWSRILRLLDALNQAKRAEDMNYAGTKFHALGGLNPTRYTVHVNGPWCITFEFSDGNAHRIDLEQYH